MLIDAVLVSIRIIVLRFVIELIQKFQVCVLFYFIGACLAILGAHLSSSLLFRTGFHRNLHTLQCALVTVLSVARSQRVLQKLQLLAETAG